MRSKALLMSALVLAGLALTGCGSVPRDRYDALNVSYRTVQEENVALRDELEATGEALRMLREQMQTSGGRVDNLAGENQRLQRELARLQEDYTGLMSRLDTLRLGPLPAELDAALRDLVARHPNMLSYDPETGMVRFSSDLTFALGSAELRPEAIETVRALAQVLDLSAAEPFEVHVVGHTDAVPIRKASTRAAHPTNLHLSVHRAIAVWDALIDAGVDPRRVMVAGYGQYRPVVQEGAGGAAENRRVEIYLAPASTDLAELPAAAGAPAETPATQTVREDDFPMK